MALSEDHFGGAKLALFIGGRLLVIRRDDRPDIPWPGHWDFPGGGREGWETPAACVLRETAEETGLILHERALTWGRAHDGPQGVTWFFAAHLDGAAESQVRLGDEGQELGTGGSDQGDGHGGPREWGVQVRVSGLLPPGCEQIRHLTEERAGSPDR